MTEQDTTGEEPRIRTVQMPPAEDMVRRLREAGLYGIAPQTDRLYDRFISEVADTPKAGLGLLTVWELSKYDTISEFPRTVQAAIEVNFDIMVDAVTPDPAIASDAKEARRQVRDQLSQDYSNDPA